MLKTFKCLGYPILVGIAFIIVVYVFIALCSVIYVVVPVTETKNEENFLYSTTGTIEDFHYHKTNNGYWEVSMRISDGNIYNVVITDEDIIEVLWVILKNREYNFDFSTGEVGSQMYLVGISLK